MPIAAALPKTAPNLQSDLNTQILTREAERGHIGLRYTQNMTPGRQRAVSSSTGLQSFKSWVGRKFAILTAEKGTRAILRYEFAVRDYSRKSLQTLASLATHGGNPGGDKEIARQFKSLAACAERVEKCADSAGASGKALVADLAGKAATYHVASFSNKALYAIQVSASRLPAAGADAGLLTEKILSELLNRLVNYQSELKNEEEKQQASSSKGSGSKADSGWSFEKDKKFEKGMRIMHTLNQFVEKSGFNGEQLLAFLKKNQAGFDAVLELHNNLIELNSDAQNHTGSDSASVDSNHIKALPRTSDYPARQANETILGAIHAASAEQQLETTLNLLIQPGTRATDKDMLTSLHDLSEKFSVLENDGFEQRVSVHINSMTLGQLLKLKEGSDRVKQVSNDKEETGGAALGLKIAAAVSQRVKILASEGYLKLLQEAPQDADGMRLLTNDQLANIRNLLNTGAAILADASPGGAAESVAEMHANQAIKKAIELCGPLQILAEFEHNERIIVYKNWLDAVSQIDLSSLELANLEEFRARIVNRPVLPDDQRSKSFERKIEIQIQKLLGNAVADTDPLEGAGTEVFRAVEELLTFFGPRSPDARANFASDELDVIAATAEPENESAEVARLVGDVIGQVKSARNGLEASSAKGSSSSAPGEPAPAQASSLGSALRTLTALYSEANMLSKARTFDKVAGGAWRTSMERLSSFELDMVSRELINQAGTVAEWTNAYAVYEFLIQGTLVQKFVLAVQDTMESFISDGSVEGIGRQLDEIEKVASLASSMDISVSNLPGSVTDVLRNYTRLKIAGISDKALLNGWKALVMRNPARVDPDEIDLSVPARLTASGALLESLGDELAQRTAKNYEKQIYALVENLRGVRTQKGKIGKDTIDALFTFVRAAGESFGLESEIRHFARYGDRQTLQHALSGSFSPWSVELMLHMERTGALGWLGILSTELKKMTPSKEDFQTYTMLNTMITILEEKVQAVKEDIARPEIGMKIDNAFAPKDKSQKLVVSQSKSIKTFLAPYIEFAI
ncbi:MAG: hypothetical protein JWQ23_2511 [Herminiimonas sp.]|nr:hypothetical protein [Herminiimonas sp.]